MGVNGGFVQSERSRVVVGTCLFINNNACYGSTFYLAEGSTLKIENSTLHHYSAAIGGCIFLANSVLNIVNTQFDNNKAFSSGGAISCLSQRSSNITNITMENCSFINNIPGVMELTERTLIANNTVFKNNISTGSGTMIIKRFPGGITLEYCVFSMKSVTGGALWQFYFNDSILRLSNTNFTSCISCAACLYFVLDEGANLTMYTWKSNINIKNKQISTINSTFLDQLKEAKMINMEGALMHWQELPFASGKLPLVDTSICYMLTWTSHVSRLILKLNHNLNLLKTSRRFLSRHSLLSMYYAHIYSHISYGITLWGNMVPLSMLSKLQHVQNQCLSYVFHK